VWLAADKVQEIANQRLLSLAQKISKLSGLKKILTAIDRFAIDLTVRYQSQLLSLKEPTQSREPEIEEEAETEDYPEIAKDPLKKGSKETHRPVQTNKQRTGKSGQKEKKSHSFMSMMMGKQESASTPAQQVGEYAAFIILEALRSGKILLESEAGKTLEVQFLEAIWMTDTATKKHEASKVILPLSVSAEPLCLGEFFHRPGALAYDEAYYAAAHTLSQEYGYRFARPDELSPHVWTLEEEPAETALAKPVLPWTSPEKSTARQAVDSLTSASERAEKKAVALEQKTDASKVEIKELQDSLLQMQQQIAMLLSGISMQQMGVIPTPHQSPTKTSIVSSSSLFQSPTGKDGAAAVVSTELEFGFQ
jgi:hypothetical protein